MRCLNRCHQRALELGFSNLQETRNQARDVCMIMSVPQCHTTLLSFVCMVGRVQQHPTPSFVKVCVLVCIPEADPVPEAASCNPQTAVYNERAERLTS